MNVHGLRCIRQGYMNTSFMILKNMVRHILSRVDVSQSQYEFDALTDFSFKHPTLL